MPGPGKLAVQVKSVGLYRTHLHLPMLKLLANCEACNPLFRPFSQTATVREDSDCEIWVGMDL